MRQAYNDVEAYITKDGSEIRELMHPSVQGNQAQSLAEAIVPPGTRTKRHRHARSEELYHVTAGRGRMFLGEEEFIVEVGDTVCIAPGAAHCIEAIGDNALRILCCCSPPYSHDDTELLDATTD